MEEVEIAIFYFTSFRPLKLRNNFSPCSCEMQNADDDVENQEGAAGQNPPENPPPLGPQIPQSSPRYPQLNNYQDRLRTFGPWPVCLTQTPHAMAEAGLFYTGRSDWVVCFHCGGALKDWEANVAPRPMHRRFFPHCPFLGPSAEQENLNVVAGAAIANVDAMNLHQVVQQAVSPPVPVAAPPAPENAPQEPAAPIDETRLCKICFARELGVVVLPCGHMIMCTECAPQFHNCPLCRARIAAKIQAFLP